MQKRGKYHLKETEREQCYTNSAFEMENFEDELMDENLFIDLIISNRSTDLQDLFENQPRYRQFINKRLLNNGLEIDEKNRSDPYFSDIPVMIAVAYSADETLKVS